jgi:hypothetical protein
MSMMNVKETLKRLHKRLPTLSLDELFELLDCYVEQSTLSTFPTWEPNKIWYSTDKINCKDTNVNTLTSISNEKIKYYDGGGSTQLVAEH